LPGKRSWWTAAWLPAEWNWLLKSFARHDSSVVAKKNRCLATSVILQVHSMGITISEFRGVVEDLVNGPAGPVTFATSSVLRDLRPLSFGVYDPVDVEDCCRSLAYSNCTALVIFE